jgi:ribosomal protein S18 acetylase RimI-like enzyme
MTGTPAQSPAAPAASAVTICRGLVAEQAVEAATLFHETFGAKLSFWPALPRDRARAVALIAGCLHPACVYTAFDEGGAVVGVAFAGPSLLRLDAAALRAAYGDCGASWRLAVLRALSAAPQERGVIHLDGFTVTPALRGAGIGSAILRRIIVDARLGGARAIELVVGATSPAVRLYHAFGFRDVGTLHTGPFRHRIGYRRLTKMRLDMSPSEEDLR